MADTKSTDAAKPEAAAAPEAAAQAQQPVQVQVVDDSALASYANFCRVTSTPEELVIDFGLNPQPVGEPDDEFRRVRVTARWRSGDRVEEVWATERTSAFTDSKVSAKLPGLPARPLSSAPSSAMSTS